MSLYRSYQLILFIVFLCDLSQNFIPTHGRDAGAGAFGCNIVSAEQFARLDWLGRHQRLARNGLVSYFTRAGAFDAIAESFFDIANRLHHRLQLIRLQTGLVVGTRKVSIQSKVLF